MSNAPSFDDPDFETKALSQLQLYKPYRTQNDLRTLSVKDVFTAHVEAGGFPFLRTGSVANMGNTVQSDCEVSLMGNHAFETCIQQDEY